MADDYVLLTPKDLLARDENLINRTDLILGFEEIPLAMPDAQVFNYFNKVLVRHTDRGETRSSGMTQQRFDEANPSEKGNSKLPTRTMF